MSSYLDELNEIFSSPSEEKALGLMSKTMLFLREIKAKMESGDPEKKKEALEETMEMKRLLESKIKALSEQTGLDIASLAALAQNS